MNFKKIFSLICLSVCFLSAFAQEIDIESLYRSSALPTGNALLAAAANGTVKTATDLQSSTFWNSMGWSISTNGDKGTPWLLPSNSKALPYQRTGNETYTPGSEVSISSKDEFLALCGAYKPYKITLTQDIDLGGDTLYSLNSIKVFDGGNFTIFNFVLKNHPTSSAVGVFTSIDTVRNLTVKIKSVDVNTYSSLGVLVGRLPSGGLIKNCHVLSNTGTVTVTGADSVGGLVGVLEGTIDSCSIKGIKVAGAKYIGGMVGISKTSATITNCSVDDVEVTASNSYVGGLIGLNRATIDSCSATRVVVKGSTSGESYVGGLVGQNNDKDVKNSKVTNGTITGNKFLGGLVGHTLSGSLSNDTVSSVIITATDEQVGGLTGYLFSVSSATNCKANRVTISSSTSNKSGGLVGYLNGNIFSCKVDSSTVSGASKIGGMVGECDKNTAKITNCAVDSIAVTATGSYVGGLIGLNRATIDSCSATRVVVKGSTSGESYVGGLVGQNNDKDVKNSKVTNGTITGNKFLGGLVGHTLSGSLSNDTVSSVIITATDEQVGGLTGYLFSVSSATNCKANRVTISSSTSNKSGGLVGYLNGNIFSCKVDSSTVSGASKIGGMVGECDKNTAKITNCAVDSIAVTATGSYVGGLIGLNRATIDTCSATRVVVKSTATYDSYVGGLVGQNNDSPVKNSKVTNSKIEGYGLLGGLVGHTLSGSLSNDTVSNVTVTATNNQAGGLTSYIVSGQTATNCKVNNITISGVNQIGGLVGLLDGSITSCKVDTASVTGTGSHIGGLVGESKDTISYSKVDNATVSGVNNSGGLVGYVSAASTLVSDTVINSKITATVYHAGGLVGCDASDGLVTVTDCRTSLDTVIGKRYVAGFVSRLNGSVTRGFADSMVIISSDATNSCAGGIVGSGEKATTAITGVSARHISVTASGPNAGGIAGYTLGSVTSSKVDTSSINGTGSVGGIVGYLAGTAPSISSCSIDSVRVFGSAHKVGGIVGCNEGNLLNDTVSNSIIISGTNASKTGGYLGGISGHNKANIVGCVVRGGSVDLYLAEATAVGCGGIAGFNDYNKYVQESMVLGTKVTLTSATVEGDGIGCGGIVGRNEGVVSKSLASSVTVKHSRVNAGTDLGSGGIAGFSKGGSITQCLVKDGTIDGQCYIGGVLGRAFYGVATYNVAITNCHVHNSVISSSNTTDNTHMGGIVGKHQGSVEKCLVTNIIFRNYNTDKTKVAIGGILAVIGGATTIQDNVAMIDYFDIRAKFTKGTMNLSRISGGKASDLTLTKNLGWVETYVKYYHKKFGLNWVNDFYKGTGHIANNLTNGDNLFAGDICATAGYSSNSATPWTTLSFSNTYWDLSVVGTKKFAVLQTFKDSTYAPLVANRGNEYMEKVKADNYINSSTAFSVPIKIFSPRAFNFGYNAYGSYFLYISASKVDLYTDILLEEDNGLGNSTFWAVDLNIGNSGNIQQSLIYQTNLSSFELDGHGYSIDGYNNPYTGTGYAKSSLINDVDNCAYTVKRLEVANYNRTFNNTANTDSKRFGALIDKVSGVSTFEDIYIKNPKIQVTNFGLANIGGLVGDVSNNITANRLVVYMTATDPLKSSFYGCLGGFFGEVFSGNVVFNNVASYSVYDFSAGSGSHYGYCIGRGTGNISNGWFGTAVLSKVGAGVPTSGGNTSGSIFDALTGASITNGTVWHIPASTVSTDSIYLVREPYTGDYSN